MIQPQTLTEKYWGAQFTLTEADIEQIYNLFLEKEKPLTIEQVARYVMINRVTEEKNEIERRLSGRILYQPAKSYQVGEELVFPALKFASGKVISLREGNNPQDGLFKVISVEINQKVREFAAELTNDHVLNQMSSDSWNPAAEADVDSLVAQYGAEVSAKIATHLKKQSEFVRLAGFWFAKSLLPEISVGHLHLAHAVLEMYEGGPLPTEEIVPHLDLDKGPSLDVNIFALNQSMLEDERFDEVAPQGQVAWFLRKMEPAEVKDTPERLRYRSIPYDRALLSPQLILLERELDDEWSNLESYASQQPVMFTLTYPHRAVGTLPLSSRIKAILPLGETPRQRFRFLDQGSGQEVIGWVVKEGRYIAGFREWFQEHNIPVGGYITLKMGEEPGTVLLDFDRRRPQREYVRLASVDENNKIKFEHNKRNISCGFDDLLIVGTDFGAAIDALFRRVESRQQSIADLLAELFPELSGLNPQNTVHAKTLYSAINMLRRVPPGPLFSELVRHPAFVAVGDHYWQFNPQRY
ncbi:MAG: hypothetical protein IPL78_15175 [Chloroflexi bacterium]|nr:hypothetical protein [Chloroflexota bacterium]